jgi:hypothetical protein
MPAMASSSTGGRRESTRIATVNRSVERCSDNVSCRRSHMGINTNPHTATIATQISALTVASPPGRRSDVPAAATAT